MNRMFALASLLTCSFAFHLHAVEIGAPVPGSPGIVYATQDGSRIRPAPGYTWVDESKTAVKWTPGVTHYSCPNVVASQEKDNWHPAPGYKWANSKNGDLSVIWTPGIAHYSYPNVVAAQEKDNWNPAPGYQWANSKSGDFSVIRRSNTDSSPSGNYNPQGGQAEDGSYYGPAGSDGQPVFTGSNGTLYNAWYEWQHPTPPPANAHWTEQQNYTIHRGAIEAWVATKLYEEQMQNPRLQVPVKTIAYLDSCVKAKGQQLDILNQVLDIQLQRQKEEAARRCR